MIVGMKNIDLKKLRRIYNSEVQLNDYCLSLVPKYLQHVDEIVMNQRFLVALNIRKLESIPFKEREYWSNYLVRDIHVTGVPTRFIDWNDVILHTDIDYLLAYTLQELNDRRLQNE